MFHHLELLLGPVWAVLAEKRLLVGVGEVVVAQSCRPAEAALAHVADVGLVLAVLLEVGFQQEACFERLATLLADEGADLAVTSLPVDAQRVGSVGAVVAFFALVWLQT